VCARERARACERERERECVCVYEYVVVCACIVWSLDMSRMCEGFGGLCGAEYEKRQWSESSAGNMYVHIYM